MENVNTVNDVQASVVETPKETEGSAMTDLTPRPQSLEENAAFRKMRLENERLRAQNERYISDQIQRQMEADLQSIRALDPEVESLEELGEEFGALIAAGISAPVAFAALREQQKAARPPAIGALSGESKREKEFYLPEEVDALSPEQLSDPTVWARVRASMTKW